MERAEVVERLRGAGFLAPEAEAEEFLRSGVDVAVAVARREAGEPLAWVTGSTLFCGRRLVVHPGVYVPRPQTEHLARHAAALLPSGGRALDLATGCGALAAVLGPGAIGVDLDPVAVRCARVNGVAAAVGELADPPVRPRSVDVVVAVAPYVPTDALRLLPSDVRDHEPVRALDGGADGLDLVRSVIAAAATVLAPGGHLLVEVGGEQHALLAPVLAAAGFGPGTPHHDAEGDLRALSSTLDLA